MQSVKVFLRADSRKPLRTSFVVSATTTVCIYGLPRTDNVDLRIELEAHDFVARARRHAERVIALNFSSQTRFLFEYFFATPAARFWPRSCETQAWRSHCDANTPGVGCNARHERTSFSAVYLCTRDFGELFRTAARAITRCAECERASVLCFFKVYNQMT